ncbi:hypothetical protein BD626DRAFT_498985 [Schizophyllum amplum]|uniref:Uncharacterized protein n=1 Tax=Schizophyllum amplum TaxID=97359 RepID=A0A550CC35_9AGAR|nr:hypothetical protein BD626DRAFT_498985 [Auriculariopsis ampla]
MISRMRRDLPVPADPVKKTLCPFFTRVRTRFWSCESLTAAGSIRGMASAGMSASVAGGTCVSRGAGGGCAPLAIIIAMNSSASSMQLKPLNTALEMRCVFFAHSSQVVYTLGPSRPFLTA